ncbi:MAG: putative oxidoreductase C-terminal domain-containing protein [Candidatus Pedobacter colombiensis]|uniref:Oxidoreductase C-terminal domain-containing protein n=1 Tax=Candidatus Pedobacter colombiensis TaxID=3121371 RepID=A0AAJ5WB82_9SPHI|nr:putative oxidoreductase C-terminal domain-containing protein [Pedobacter sp.]WEK20249.1 MAG: putative oxidoreductase C-terminal domain-containing protein [Pedobacter sp.]
MKYIKPNCLMIALFALSCKMPSKESDSKIKLITLDPGHFHAALVQKSMYPDVDSTVYVYAPEGQDLDLHLDKITAYNQDPIKPTYWKEDVYKGEDYLKRMIADKKGNVVVISGNNLRKTEYIKSSIDAGFNVLADKPMAIDEANFEVLKTTFATAREKKLLLYDIMTERSEITNILQRELVGIPEIFGTLEKGSPEHPAVEMESIHYFYKYVSGKVLTRPAWFMDVSQQGEGIADVAVHLVDLVQWSCFPDQIINYEKDVQVNTARRWSTHMTLSQFTAITKNTAFPDYLKKDVKDSVLKVYANGEINYKLHDVYVKVKALWDYKANAGGDSHYAVFRGTKANLIIKQGEAQGYKPTLYIEPVGSANATVYEKEVSDKMNLLKAKYAGVELKKVDKGWEVIIPEHYKNGHEAHFAQVMDRFLSYLKNGDMPAWEVPNMIAKYYTTTKALTLAKKGE